MEGKNKMAGADFITSLVLIAFGFLVISASLKMKVFRTLIVSPGLFPLILGVVFVFFGICILIISLKHDGFRQAGLLFRPEYWRGVFTSPRFFRGGVVFLLVLAYVLLFGNPHLAKLNFTITAGNEIIPVNVGFIVTTAGYLFLTFSYLKSMRKGTAAIVSLVAAFLIFYAFNKGFGIPVP